MMAKRLLVIFMHYSQQESRQNGLFFYTGSFITYYG